MVTASLSSLTTSNVMLQSVRLEGSSADTGAILVHCPDPLHILIIKSSLLKHRALDARD